MIKIVIKRDESSNKITSIEVKGHSGKDVKGKDLVCAAISAIIRHLKLKEGLELSDKDYDFKLESGHAYIKALDIPSDYDAVVLRTIETQFKTVEESEKDFVRVENL